jgi:hypothetical protein
MIGEELDLSLARFYEGDCQGRTFLSPIAEHCLPEYLARRRDP